MDKIKEVVNDPARLDAELKKAFEKMDADKKGFITHEALKAALIEQAKALGLPKPEKEPTEEEKEKARKIADPDGSGKITFENFVKLMHAGIEKAKAMGKI
jgi:Ca2+-binding EF-hand superfamily protein